MCASLRLWPISSNKSASIEEADVGEATVRWYGSILVGVTGEAVDGIVADGSTVVKVTADGGRSGNATGILVIEKIGTCRMCRELGLREDNVFQQMVSRSERA